MDTTLNVNDILYDSEYENKVNEALSCFGELYELRINDQLLDFENLFFTRHKNSYERGVMTMLDISELSNGLNTVEIKKLDIKGNTFGREITRKDLVYEPFVKVPFWKE